MKMQPLQNRKVCFTKTINFPNIFKFYYGFHMLFNCCNDLNLFLACPACLACLTNFKNKPLFNVSRGGGPVATAGACSLQVLFRNRGKQRFPVPRKAQVFAERN